jgi:hypothetical protein
MSGTCARLIAFSPFVNHQQSNGNMQMLVWVYQQTSELQAGCIGILLAVYEIICSRRIALSTSTATFQSGGCNSLGWYIDVIKSTG